MPDNPQHRRFIAGAVCPRCAAMDKIAVDLDTDQRGRMDEENDAAQQMRDNMAGLAMAFGTRGLQDSMSETFGVDMVQMGSDSEGGSTLEVGKYADIIALASDPTSDIGALQTILLVMKGGAVYHTALPAPGSPPIQCVSTSMSELARDHLAAAASTRSSSVRRRSPSARRMASRPSRACPTRVAAAPARGKPIIGTTMPRRRPTA